MNLILNLSLRNLLRQKKRNLLLGLGIAFGMMILVIANSFSHGMVDVLIKDIVTNVFGHLVVDCTARGNSYSIIRDRARIEKIIYRTIPKTELEDISESLGTFGRAVGNGETDNIVVVGVTLDTPEKKRDFFRNFFTLIAGDFKEYYSKEIAYPVIISAEKAKSLNVKVHDVIRARFPMVTGQIQAVKLTVIAIANSNNTFMNIVLFMDGDRLKKMLGYKPWESGALQLTLKDPQKTATKYADLLYAHLNPNVLSIQGKSGAASCQLVAFKNTATAKRLLAKKLQLTQGEPSKAFGESGVMISQQLATQLAVKAGDEVVFQYPAKFRGVHQESFKLTAVYQTRTKFGGAFLLVNQERIYEMANRYLPAAPPAVLAETDPLYPALATEWKLLPRSHNSEALNLKYQKERKQKTKQPRFDVVTMYEGASDVLKIEGVLNLITMVAVLILFFIILIGVINTLRMTIKERTREIGTVRAIGMQKADVRNMFMMETLLLTAISCLAGIILGIIAILILGSIQFDIKNALSMILKNKHLYFKIDPLGLGLNFMLIMLIAAVTSYFPAQRAARLTAVEALRHYE